MHKFNSIFTASLITLFFISCTPTEKPKTDNLTGFVFGTTYSLVFPETTENYQTSIDSLFYLVNKSLSTYLPTSDISKINNGDSTVVVDAYFSEVFVRSKKIFTETNGFFDPTVGNLVNAYGFGPKRQQVDLSDEEVKNHMKFVGFDKVTLHNNQIKKENAAIYLDFNAIAKGYGIDVVSLFLESKNIQNYLVEIGGEIRTKGVNKKGKPWRIAIDNPNSDGTRNQSKFLNLYDKSMATSGNYRKFRISENGKKYVHTINPKTGFATESNLLSASVIASLDCADVDAYATAFMAMGLEKTVTFLGNHKNIDAILFFINKKGEFQEFSTFNR